MNKDSTNNFYSPLVTEKQAALYLARSVSSIRRDRRHGCGPVFVRIGRSIRYATKELDRFIADCASDQMSKEVRRG